MQTCIDLIRAYTVCLTLTVLINDLSPPIDCMLFNDAGSCVMCKVTI